MKGLFKAIFNTGSQFFFFLISEVCPSSLTLKIYSFIQKMLRQAY